MAGEHAGIYAQIMQECYAMPVVGPEAFGPAAGTFRTLLTDEAAVAAAVTGDIAVVCPGGFQIPIAMTNDEVKNYDPKMRHIDQSPFHANEAGSAECNTLALTGAPTVPLIEDHAATRERWSLNSVTDSCKERVLKEIPGFELMFKFEGKNKEAELQAYVASKNLPFKVSVVTGPSGSYTEQDILAFLETSWHSERSSNYIMATTPR
jgi:hypothetical protein